MKITADYYSFLLDIGCPYEGYVQGLGDAYCVPVLTGSSTPLNNSQTGNATYLSINYCPTVVPRKKQVTEKEVNDYIEKELIKLENGEYYLKDINTNRWEKLGKSISKEIYIVDNEVSICLTGTSGRTYTYVMNEKSIRGGYNVQPNKDGSSENEISIGRLLYEIGDNGVDFMEHKLSTTPYNKKVPKVFSGTKRNTKVKHTYDTMKKLKSKGINISTKPAAFVDKTLPKIVKGAGRATMVLSSAFILYDIYDNKAVKASHLLDTGMMLVAAIPYVGWAISLSYFVIDAGFSIFTDRSLGDRLDDLVEDLFGLEGGVLLDLNPVFDWIDESVDDVIRFFSSPTFSF